MQATGPTEGSVPHASTISTLAERRVVMRSNFVHPPVTTVTEKFSGPCGVTVVGTFSSEIGSCIVVPSPKGSRHAVARISIAAAPTGNLIIVVLVNRREPDGCNDRRYRLNVQDAYCLSAACISAVKSESLSIDRAATMNASRIAGVLSSL